MKSDLTYKIISEIGVQEKYVRAAHYNTIKVWWARRPLTAMRSLLIREILNRGGITSLTVDTELYSALNPSIEKFMEFSKEHSTSNLKVLDVFAGGGSIPLESARLGCETYSAELNPVASLLQETIFNSLKIEGYGRKLKEAGYSLIDRVEKRVGQFFIIDDITPYVIFWSKTAKCKSCSTELDLRRLEYLSKKTKKPKRLVASTSGLRIEESFGKEEKLQKTFTCKACGEEHTFKDIKRYCETNSFGYSPFALCYTNKGKQYKVVEEKQREILISYNSQIKEQLSELKALIPQGIVKGKGGVINPTLYDLKRPADFFTHRQLLVLLTVIDEIIREYSIAKECHGESEAKQIVLGLTSLIEFLVDWNSVSTMWISQNEQTGRSLAGPGVGMKWDFIEINPFSKAGSNLRSKIDRVCNTFEALHINNKVNIIKGSSTLLNLPDKSIDIILTDPPYYDSVDYTGLSEFFRPWFEIVINNTYDKNISLINEDHLEAIVELDKKSLKNHNHYGAIMTGVLQESNRVLKQNGSALMLFSHKTFEGWKVIADSFLKSSLYVSDCFPIEMERIARPRAMSYNALNGVVTFRLVKSPIEISPIKIDILQLKEKLAIGEILDSQIVIYLAALAVKQVTLSGESYETCYNLVIKTYEKIRIEKWVNSEVDLITKSYLEAKIKGNLKDLEKPYYDTLIDCGLTINSRLLTMEEISVGEKIKNTLLEEAVNIYNAFKYNSKTKIDFAANLKEGLLAFFSVLSGIELNTVAKRSSSNEENVARLVLSKVK